MLRTPRCQNLSNHAKPFSCASTSATIRMDVKKKVVLRPSKTVTGQMFKVPPHRSQVAAGFGQIKMLCKAKASKMQKDITASRTRGKVERAQHLPPQVWAITAHRPHVVTKQTYTTSFISTSMSPT